MDGDVLAGFRDFSGAIAANHDAGTVAVSSPQGDALAVLDAATGKVISFQTLVEVCGLAPDQNGFIVTTGRGKVIDAAVMLPPSTTISGTTTCSGSGDRPDG